MKNHPVQIVFLGTPEFAAPILEKLINSEYKPAAVFCAPNKPVGRKQILTPPPVKIIAQKYGIPIYQPTDVSSFKFQVSSFKPDLIITAAYGLILPKEVLDAPRYGCLNIHPSLLPKYRGPSPIQSAILNGDETTGVTIYKMDEQIDRGPIIAQESIVIASVAKQSRYIAATHGIAASSLDGLGAPRNDKLTTPELSKKLSALGADLLIKTLPDWLAGRLAPTPQNDSKAIYTKIITKQDGQINWQKPALKIERQIRAYTPWPSSYTNLKIKNENIKIKILEAETSSSPHTQNILSATPFTQKPLLATPLTPRGAGVVKPGEIFLTDTNKLAVQTGNGALLVKKLQLEGGKPMNAPDFLRGHHNFLGKALMQNK